MSDSSDQQPVREDGWGEWRTRRNQLGLLLVCSSLIYTWLLLQVGAEPLQSAPPIMVALLVVATGWSGAATWMPVAVVAPLLWRRLAYRVPGPIIDSRLPALRWEAWALIAFGLIVIALACRWHTLRRMQRARRAGSTMRFHQTNSQSSAKPAAMPLLGGSWVLLSLAVAGSVYLCRPIHLVLQPNYQLGLLPRAVMGIMLCLGAAMAVSCGRLVLDYLQLLLGKSRDVAGLHLRVVLWNELNKEQKLVAKQQSRRRGTS